LIVVSIAAVVIAKFFIRSPGDFITAKQALFGSSSWKHENLFYKLINYLSVYKRLQTDLFESIRLKTDYGFLVSTSLFCQSQTTID
jgi:hypothetical protein